jgi:hypothetical protein
MLRYGNSYLLRATLVHRRGVRKTIVTIFCPLHYVELCVYRYCENTQTYRLRQLLCTYPLYN